MIVFVNKKSIMGFAVCLVLVVVLCFSIPNVISTFSSASNSFTVIIDAGHGGMDGGCVAKDGTVEKDLNLDISLKLRELFEISGINTVMTRKDGGSTYDSEKFNKNADIKARIELINSYSNCVVLSIHMNNFSDSRYNGSQIFYSNDDFSKALSETIRADIVSFLQPDNTRKIKPIPSSVLLFKRIKNPAILCECGFFSNEAELEKLKSDSYRTQLALVIYNAFMKYISQ
ncbi:MAG: cell wall hydrolase [Ruminococcaceae bacterium]|nr:cell wall hydrolase [Oscillospiraceae bacterium]